MHYNLKINKLGTTEFSPHILLNRDVKYQIALRHGIIKKSWYNISVALQNNTFTYNSVVYILGDGNYDLSSLQEEIQIVTSSSISFRAVRHSGRVEVINNTANTLILQGLASVLGFTSGTIIAANTRLIGTLTPDFSGGHIELELHCSLVDSKFMRHEGRTSRHLRSIVDESVGNSHIRIVEDAHYIPMQKTDVISSVTLELRNHNGQLIEIPNNETCEFVLEIKPI